MIIPLNPDNQKHVEATAKLHKELLNESPIVQLGDIFMKEIYYSSLVKAKLFQCDLYYHNGEYVGFISYTSDPLHFMQKSVKIFFLRLFYIVFKSVILKPSLAKTVINVCREMMQRKSLSSQIDDRDLGEMLSLGVIKEGCKLVDADTGKRVPNLLFEGSNHMFSRVSFFDSLIFILYSLFNLRYSLVLLILSLIISARVNVPLQEPIEI